VDENPESLL
jgi:hypothetical protein